MYPVALDEETFVSSLVIRGLSRLIYEATSLALAGRAVNWQSLIAMQALQK